MNDAAPVPVHGIEMRPVSIPAPLPVVCMAIGDLYGLADTYITRMFEMLKRHCPVPFHLVCYTDQPRTAPRDVEFRDCSGWHELERDGMRATTRKLGLFNPDYVEFDEYLYLDLTLVIRRSMDALIRCAFSQPQDLIVVEDWHHGGYNSSVMRIRPAPLRFIYDAFVAGESFPFRVPGDQDFIRAAVLSRGEQARVAMFPDGWVVSFKGMMRIGRRDPDRARGLIEHATVVKFHGQPRMHEAFDPVHHFFRIRLRDWAHGRLRSPISIADLKSHWVSRLASER